MANSAFQQDSSGVTDATVLTSTDEIAVFPNSIDLGSLTSGALKITVAVGIATPSISAALTSIDGLVTAANQMIYTTALDTYAVTDLTSLARSLLDDTTQAAMVGTILSGAVLTAVTVGGTDKVVIQDVSDADNAKTVTAQSIADLAGGGTGGASTSLNNLASVAINTSLVSDTDVTDSLGSQAIRWNNVYAATLQTGDTAADTLQIGAWDVDGAVFVPFITCTANNTPTCVIASATTGTTQALNDASTKLATTAYVNNTVKLGQTNVAANSNTTFTQDVNTNQYFKITFTSNCTLAFAFNTGLVQSMCVELINAGAFTVTLPGGLEWAGGAAPTFTAAGTDIIVVWNNGDDVIRAALIGQDFS